MSQIPIGWLIDREVCLPIQQQYFDQPPGHHKFQPQKSVHWPGLLSTDSPARLRQLLHPSCRLAEGKPVRGFEIPWRAQDTVMFFLFS